MDSALLDRTSQQFLGQWRRLVSTTNWEKGQIIHEWRETLRKEGASNSDYSDEAWSRRVGNATAQHVGRLRRAFERFGGVREDYPGLYWSHFQAALDWDDAEMWLEGAVQNDWSISEMRQKRWETSGDVAGQRDAQEASLAEPWDEDAELAEADIVSGTVEVVQSPEDEEGYDRSEFDDEGTAGEAAAPDEAVPSRREAVRPFANLAALPPDVNDAFEAYKLCILRHKLAGWQEISRNDMVASLRALEQLALAPSDA